MDATPVTAIANAITEGEKLLQLLIKKSHSIPQQKKKEYFAMIEEQLSCRNMLRNEVKNLRFPNVILDLSQKLVNLTDEIEKYHATWNAELSAEPEVAT